MRKYMSMSTLMTTLPSRLAVLVPIRRMAHLLLSHVPNRVPRSAIKRWVCFFSIFLKTHLEEGGLCLQRTVSWCISASVVQRFIEDVALASINFGRVGNK